MPWPFTVSGSEAAWAWIVRTMAARGSAQRSSSARTASSTVPTKARTATRPESLNDRPVGNLRSAKPLNYLLPGRQLAANAMGATATQFYGSRAASVPNAGTKGWQIS